MANSIDFLLTNAAEELISKVLAGKTLNFTRMAVGDGFSYDTNVAKGFKNVVNEVLSLDITKKETLSPSSVRITSAFKNTDAQKEFYYREVGLYAQDPDTGEEVLYAYGNRNDAAELITPAGSNIVTKQLIFIISVGDSANVTFNVNADVYALQSDMLDVQSNKADKNLANTGMITNCLLEVPQRIKYDLTDGTLTIKAGSVVIVPYGTAEPTYSIGDKFLTNKFKVKDILYDTESENPQLFYWLEILQDISMSGKTATKPCFLIISTDTAGLNIANADTATSGSSYGTYLTYNTNENYVKYNNTPIYALPLMILNYSVDGNLSSINQVFNGMGYIGSTVWVDKGVKGLIPNGRNPDGTLNNIIDEVKNIRFSSRTVDGIYPIIMGPDIGLNIGYINYVESEEMPVGNWMIWYKQSESTMYIAYDTVGEFQKIPCLFGGTVSINSGRITSLVPKLSFKLVDYNDYIDRITKLESRISALEIIETLTDT